jgi:uncharacterized protein with NRDE domain
MCLIVVALGVAPRYPLIVAANRDEQHVRPTRAAAWWSDAPHVVGGRDLQAGGTWLAMDRRGRFAAVTNIRDPNRPIGLRSRGSLVAEFLLGTESAAAYASRAIAGGALFGAFHLLVYDGGELYAASNRAAAVRLGPGTHAFSNAPPGVEWPKAASAREGVERRLAATAHGEAPDDGLFELLARRDDSKAAEHYYQRTHFVRGETYGTRCSTVVLLDAAGRATFSERSFDAAGQLVGEVRESFAIDRPR